MLRHGEAAAAAVDQYGWALPVLLAIDATLPKGWLGLPSLTHVKGVLNIDMFKIMHDQLPVS